MKKPTDSHFIHSSIHFLPNSIRQLLGISEVFRDRSYEKITSVSTLNFEQTKRVGDIRKQLQHILDPLLSSMYYTFAR